MTGGSLRAEVQFRRWLRADVTLRLLSERLAAEPDLYLTSSLTVSQIISERRAGDFPHCGGGYEAQEEAPR